MEIRLFDRVVALPPKILDGPGMCVYSGVAGAVVLGDGAALGAAARGGGAGLRDGLLLVPPPAPPKRASRLAPASLL